jgi:hypothetical protein
MIQTLGDLDAGRGKVQEFGMVCGPPERFNEQ